MTTREAFGDLEPRVRSWIADDPDQVTREQTEALLANAERGDAVAQAELEAAFAGRLSFGTAGLRAALGPGPCRMNRLVVAQSTAGFAAFLWERARAGACADPPSVVIGFDARIGSSDFAQEASRVLSGAGIRVVLLPRAAPTPLTAFAVSELGVSAGIMITASHNPAHDNGYKVYLGDADAGSQVASPDDRAIERHIERVARRPYSEIPRADGAETAPPTLEDAYVAATAASLGGPSRVAPHAGRAVSTAMHGVGSRLSRRVFAAMGLPEPLRLEEQDEPDGTFPTLPYPNPEEPGALDLIYAFARSHEADLVIAHDPDADRLAIAAPDAAAPEAYRRLTGNELGLLLGWRAAERAARQGGRGVLANTIVSSPALGAVAAAYGLEHVETLSGFKWVSRVPNLIFGFEESLGYLSNPETLRDKDGISAACEAYALVSELHSAGRTIWDALDDASMRFGHFASRQIVKRCASAREIARITEQLRRQPPAELGGFEVAHLRDLSIPGIVPVPADVLCFDLSGGSRVMIRPSGTEPKLKIYLDICCADGTLAERHAAAESALAPLEHAVRGLLDDIEARTP